MRRTSCAVRRQQRALLRLLAEPGRGPQLEPAAGDAALGSSLGHGHGSAAERGPRARQGVWGPQRKPRGQVSDHQRRGEAPQYPRQLHPVAEASEFATTRRFSKPTRRLITPEDFKKRDEVLRMFIKKSMGFRLNQLDTLSELSLNEDILRAFGESPLAEARHEAREPIQRRGVRRCKHPLGFCSNQLRVQRLCRWVSSNGRVSHVTLGRACHMLP